MGFCSLLNRLECVLIIWSSNYSNNIDGFVCLRWSCVSLVCTAAAAAAVDSGGSSGPHSMDILLLDRIDPIRLFSKPFFVLNQFSRESFNLIQFNSHIQHNNSSNIGGIAVADLKKKLYFLSLKQTKILRNFCFFAKLEIDFVTHVCCWWWCNGVFGVT